MEKVHGGDIAEGEGITSETGVYGTLLVYIRIPREDTMGISVSGVPLHAHERTGGKVLVIPTIFLAMKRDDNSGLKSYGVYFAIEDRYINVGVEVVGDGVFQDNEVTR